MKVELDPDLQEFIHSIKEPMTIEGQRDLCIEEFGTERVSSKSALGRYLQKVRRLIEEEERDDE